MRRCAICLTLLALSGCGLFEAAPPAGPGSIEGWRLASGRMPTRAEYAAIVAACQERAVRAAQDKPLDSCLGELGLKRAE
ncbi:MAG TPA: hypothetical protein VKQ73_09430 [Stellaceae bacterium]|nr:hypothetical protein [Stellaceae bacterium]